MNARGFTLIEMLIALVVLSVGLLGAAAMLLASLQGQSHALRHATATGLVRDMADRIRANPRAGTAYDTRNADAAPGACDAAAACDAAGRAALDRAQFASAAQALLPGASGAPIIFYEPATGPAAPDRYLITLRWRDGSTASVEITQQVLALSPVAG